MSLHLESKCKEHKRTVVLVIEARDRVLCTVLLVTTRGPTTVAGRAAQVSVLCRQDVENLGLLLGLGLDRETDKVWGQAIAQHRLDKHAQRLEMRPGLEDFAKIRLGQSQNGGLKKKKKGKGQHDERRRSLPINKRKSCF